MIYLIYGPDTYRSWQKLEQIKQKYLNISKGEADLTMVEGKELSTKEFSSLTQAVPLLARSRLVVIRNLLLEGKKEIQEGIALVLEAVPKSSVVFFYESGLPDRRLKLFQALKAHQTQLFTKLEGGELHRFIAATAAEKGLTLRESMIALLIERTKGEMWQLVSELEKLSLYQSAHKSPIDMASFDRLVTGQAELVIFDLTDALGERNSQKALQLLALADHEENGLGLLALVAGHYRNLLLVADGLRRQCSKEQLGRELKLHPFVYSKLWSQARTYRYQELISCYQYLLALDIAAKQSLIEPVTGLTVLATSLSELESLPDLTEKIMVE